MGDRSVGSHSSLCYELFNSAVSHKQIEQISEDCHAGKALATNDTKGHFRLNNGLGRQESIPADH